MRSSFKHPFFNLSGDALRVSAEILFEHASELFHVERLDEVFVAYDFDEGAATQLRYGAEQETRVFVVVRDEDERARMLFYLTREEGRAIG